MTGRYYSVVTDFWRSPLPDPLEYGYECGRDFRHALWQLADKWKGRTGECVGECHGFLLLRFHDTPGGRPDEAWMPPCLLREAEAPPRARQDDPDESDGADGELDAALGFD